MLFHGQLVCVSQWHCLCECLRECVRYTEPLGHLYRGTNADSCSYFAEIFVVVLLEPYKEVAHLKQNVVDRTVVGANERWCCSFKRHVWTNLCLTYSSQSVTKASIHS